MIKKIGIVVLLLIFLMFPALESRANVIDDSESFYDIINSDGEKILTVIMKKGIITF